MTWPHERALRSVDAECACLFLLLFAVYFTGQSGAVASYRDAGDFVAAIPQLGIPHPPGYPLYTLLGRLSLWMLPWANAAYRLHLFSGACAAAAPTFAYRCLRVCGVPFVASLLSAVFWALSPAVIELARVAEMYTLAALATSVVFYAASADTASGDFSKACLCFFLFGLAAAVHPTLALLAPILLCIAWKFPKPSSWTIFVIFAVAGFSLYLYLPVRAAQSPFSNWGNPSHWRNFWRVVTRADYGGLRLHPVESRFEWTPQDILHQLVYFFTAFGSEWRWAGLVLGLWGAVVGAFRPTDEKYRRLLWGTLAAWTLLGPGFVVLSNLPLNEPTTPAILQPYLLVMGILWIPFVALGVKDLMQRLPDAAGAPLVGAVIVLLSWRGIAGALDNTRRMDFYAYDYGRNLLRSLPPGAVLFDPDDPTAFTVRALQATEGRRRDVIPLNFFRTRWGYEQIRQRYPDLLPSIDIPNAQALQSLLWSYAIQKHPFFVELPQKLNGIAYRAEGLVYAVRADPTAATLQIAGDNFERAVAHGPLRADRYADFFTQHLIDYYADAHANLGLDLAAAGRYDAAIAEYKAALCIDENLAAAYNDWAVVEFQERHYPQAVSLYRRALALDPNNEGFKKNLVLANHAL